jgi:hypothetical protein
MIDTLTRAATLSASLALATLTSVGPASSQAPTQAQRDAIKSQCRDDYIAHCSSVPPGGAASLQCLQKNMASLAPGCASAVNAVAAPAAPKADAAPKTESAPAATTETAPAATAAKPATAAGAPTAAKRPSSAQIAAIRSACRSDYPKVCAGVPTGGAPALQCLAKNQARLSAACGQAVAAASGGGATPAGAATGTAAAPAAAPATMALRPLRPREEIFVLRSACGGDVRSICGGVQPGGGRIVRCLADNAGSLSPACREVLAPFAAR